MATRERQITKKAAPRAVEMVATRAAAEVAAWAAVEVAARVAVEVVMLADAVQAWWKSRRCIW